MEYLKELEVISTWIKAVANLNSFRLAEAKPKVGRPIILWEAPSRSRDRNLSRYQYVVKVKQYGRLFVKTLEDTLRIQELLINDLEEKVGVLPIMDGAELIGRLKEVTIDFTESENLDVPFSISYEVTYGRTKPTEPPAATTVSTKVITSYP